MYRPIWYYSGIVTDTVHEGISAFGNPLVWWAGIPAFLFMLYLGIKKKDKIDKQLYLQALHEYFNDRTNDHAQLIRYAKIFHIERPVRDYMDILTG